MEYIDLTNEIYHGHEQEYTPITAPLSLTDSNSSLPTIWRNHHASITNAKPLPIPYPRKRNDKLDNTIRLQMNDFMRHSLQQNHPNSDLHSSVLTPYQTASIHKKVKKLTIKRRNTNTNTSKHPLSRRSSSDKFVKINNNASNDDNLNANPSRNAYLSNTTSMVSKSYSVSHTNSSSYKSSHKSDKNSQSYINLADISMNIDKYENEIDFYKNRDNVIKQYVECGDKKKGTQSIIEIYLQRWHEEEMLNIPKIHYCFDNGPHTHSPKKHRKKKKATKNLRVIKRKKICKNKSYDHIDKKQHKKRHCKRRKRPKMKIPAINTKLSQIENESSEQRNKLMNSSVDISKRFTFGSGNIKQFVSIPRSTISFSMSQSAKAEINNININNKRCEYNQYIPQPRASIIEKTFTWSDYHANEQQICKPLVY